MLKIKICGITRPEDAIAAAEEGADYVGLIFAKSSRKIDIKIAQDILWALPKGLKELGAPVIKSFETYNEGSLEKLKKFDAFAFLLDLPKGGGTGTRAQIDPEFATLAKRHGKVLLAGKLTADSVGAMIHKVRPWGVDVCSAIERHPGIKEPSKLRDFIQAAREAHKETTRIKVRTR